MRNNRGYSVVLVLLILAVISLLGSASLIMSRLDTNFTGAAKNYDVLFNLADGACSIAFNDIMSRERSIAGPKGASGSIRIGPLFNQLAEKSIGNYYVYEVWHPSPPQGTSSAVPGWEIGAEGFSPEFWTGEGHASRLLGSLMVEVAILKIQRVSQ